MPKESLVGRIRARLPGEIGEAMNAVRLLRGPLLTSIAAAVVLYAPDQVRELYRIAAADRIFTEIAFGIASLTVMSIVLWWVAFQIATRMPYRGSADTSLARAIRAIAPTLIGVLPLVACGMGVLGARPDTGAKAISEEAGLQWLMVGAEIAAQLGRGLSHGASAMFVLAGFVMLVGGVVQIDHHRHAGAAPANASVARRGYGFFSLFGAIVSILIVGGMTTAVMMFPVALPQAIGTATILAVFFIAVVLMAGQFTFWSETSRIPIFAGLTIAALAFSAMDLNDNHEIATLPAPKPTQQAISQDSDQSGQPPMATYSSDYFDEWFKSRPGRERFKSTYPVYIVAAQGGGIYAAYHSAALLARIQDLCPEFRNHLFAISSVSGGSLGAATFAAVTEGLANSVPEGRKSALSSHHDQACGPLQQRWLDRHRSFGAPLRDSLRGAFQLGPHEAAVKAIISSDFLAPLAAGTLFPDFTQRFLPVPVAKLDRARWLDHAFDDSWRLTGIPGRNPFQESVARMWDPEGPAPLLMMNTTIADNGLRQVIWPFGEDEQKNVDSFPTSRRMYYESTPMKTCDGLDISLSTAVGLSARFPWLTPAGTLVQNCTINSMGDDNGKAVTWRRRIVDGGYLDNSGVDTAVGLAKKLHQHLEKVAYRPDGPNGPRVELHLIVLSTNELPSRASFALGDALEPIRTLLATRSARTFLAIDRARQEWPRPDLESAKSKEKFNRRVHVVKFENPLYTIPLGWRLSAQSRDIIDMQVGRFGYCANDTGYGSSADCLQLMIYDQLNEGVEDRQRKPETSDATEVTDPDEKQIAELRECVGSSSAIVSMFGAGGSERTWLPVLTTRSFLPSYTLSWMLKVWGKDRSLTNSDWLAYLLAYAAQELGTGYIQPIAETCLSEACARRQTTTGGLAEGVAHENGRHYHARGAVALRGATNYQRMSERLGINVFKNPQMMSIPAISMMAVVHWFTDESFSGDKHLARFTGPEGFNAEAAFKAHLGQRYGDGTPQWSKALDHLMAHYNAFRKCTPGLRFDK